MLTVVCYTMKVRHFNELFSIIRTIGVFAFYPGWSHWLLRPSDTSEPTAAKYTE